MVTTASRFPTVELRDGHTGTIREVTRADLDAILEMGARCSDESIQNRFFSPRREPTPAERRMITDVDGHDRYALLVEVGDDVIAVGRWMRTDPDVAPELAFLVEDRYQGNRIGAVLLDELVTAAREQGHATLTASVLGTNAHMLRVFDNSPYPTRRAIHGGLWDVTVGTEPA